MFVEERFALRSEYVQFLQNRQPIFGYGQFSKVIYYMSYSRRKADGTQEHWADTVVRVTNGIMSIRKNWYIRNHIKWDEERWQRFAFEFACYMFDIKFLPPGRGLWAMGTDLIYTRGAMALYNCAFTSIGDDWIEDLGFLMDTLMWGVGVGFEPIRQSLKLTHPDEDFVYQIPDTREGWCESVKLLLRAFQGGRYPRFDYSLIRPEGALIKTFGGSASGPAPLIDLHNALESLCYDYANNIYGDADVVKFKTDIANLLGLCVVTGNVRRSAEIALAPISDPVFSSLKNYDLHPDRAAWGWMSNNSVKLFDDKDFLKMHEIAQANIMGHDVGFVNMRNMPLGRIGKDDNIFSLQKDPASGLNPCGEIPLESREVCNLAETFPTRCLHTEDWLRACMFATFYASTVALLPTHQEYTNSIILRNRRIGVSITGFTGWSEEIGLDAVTSALRRGYKVVREVNNALAREAGVAPSIRVTTVKPSGTVSKLAGCTSGAGYPTFHHTLRRIRVKQNTPMFYQLIKTGYAHEPDIYSKQTEVFEFPILQGPAKPASEVSIWESAFNLILLQREWADNSVSNTLYFKDGEEKDLVDVLSHVAPLVKSASLLRHTKEGIFKQIPEEGISPEEYQRRLDSVNNIDWSSYSGTDGTDEKYCNNESCSIL